MVRTPDAERQRKSTENRKKAGGKRLPVNLRPGAVEGLKIIRRITEEKSDTEVINRLIEDEKQRLL